MNRFERLSRLKDYRVDKRQLDPRGWEVANLDGRTIGEVKDLIVDTPTMKAIYLDVALDPKLFDLRGDPRVLVPIERAERRGTHRRLVVPGLDPTKVHEICGERERSYYEFWERWWTRDLSADELRRAVEHARPGEPVRIPVANEEIVVERRPLHPDERVTAHAADEPPPGTSTSRHLDL
jgi:hypothetical protein